MGFKLILQNLNVNFEDEVDELDHFDIMDNWTFKKIITDPSVS